MCIVHCKHELYLIFCILFFSYIFFFFLPVIAVQFAIEPPALCDGMLSKVQMLLNFENVYIGTMWGYFFPSFLSSFKYIIWIFCLFLLLIWGFWPNFDFSSAITATLTAHQTPNSKHAIVIKLQFQLNKLHKRNWIYLIIFNCPFSFDMWNLFLFQWQWIPFGDRVISSRSPSY